MSTPLNLSKPDRPIQVGVILMDTETETLDVAPVDMLNSISNSFLEWFTDELVPPHIRAQALPMEFHWVNQTGKGAKLTGGITVQPTDDFSTCPPLDIILMGAHRADYTPNKAELDFVRKSYESCSAFLTICAGSQPAIAAGLLKGKSATAPKMMLDQLRKDEPETTWVEKRWHRDGKIWTSGVLLNGLELMRAFATEYWGGKGGMAEFTTTLGDWPNRDVNYADAQAVL